MALDEKWTDGCEKTYNILLLLLYVCMCMAGIRTCVEDDDDDDDEDADNEKKAERRPFSLLSRFDFPLALFCLLRLRLELGYSP